MIDNFKFDFADNVTEQLRIFYLDDTIITYEDTLRNTFDDQGRLIDSYHTLAGSDAQHLSRMAYDFKDLLKTKYLGGTGSGFLQKVDYTYRNNRFLKGINETMETDDLFSLALNYDQDIVGLTTGKKNGNIASLQWKVKGRPSQQYGYSYDKLDRLTAAKYNLNNNAYGTEYGYDQRGNFTSIKRRGVYSNGLNFLPQVIDEMQFTTVNNSNKIQTIMDSAPCPDNKVVHQTLDNTEIHAVASELQADNIINETADITFQAGTSITLKAGFHAKAGTNFVAKIADCPQSGFETDGFVERSSNSYQYDANGNMTVDPNKGIAILYNYFNQPYKVMYDNGNTIEWLYSGDNVKLQKLTRRNGITLLKQDYFGGIEFRNDTLEALYFDVGRLFFEDGSAHYEYSIGDHLDNARVLFSDSNKNGTIEDNEISKITAFYPFGMSMKGAELRLNPTCDYLFNGNERQADFGLNTDDFNARHYDSAIGRFWHSDPLAEIITRFSPYHFTFNNPISFNDPTGMMGNNVTTNVVNEETGEELNIDDSYDFDFVVSDADFNTIRDNTDGSTIPFHALSGSTTARWISEAFTSEVEKFKKDYGLLGRGLGFFGLDDASEIGKDLSKGRIKSASFKIGTGRLKILKKFLRKFKLNKKQPPKGYKGGRNFDNDGRGGGEILPKRDKNGNPVTYKEYDIKPNPTGGASRGKDRVVIGSDGRRYFTKDHYKTFIDITDLKEF